MARTIRDASLELRAARSRLRPRGKPYYRAVQEGLHLGYRKPKGRLRAGGKWVVRLYTGNQTYEVETIAVADDFSDADGLWVLDYGQAQVRARQMGVERARTAAGIRGPYTVADAMDDYFAYLETEGRSETAIEDARTRDRAFIRPALGSEEVASLTSERLKRWRDALAKAPPRVRTRAGKPQEHRASAPSVGDKSADRAGRARRATANRIWTSFAPRSIKRSNTTRSISDNEWRKIKPFKGVDATRPGHLSVAEAKRLINGCDAEFRPLVQAALLTGARYGQLATLIASDFDPDVGTLRVRTRKGDGSVKEYHVQLTREGAQFFTRRCAGRASSDPAYLPRMTGPSGRNPTRRARCLGLAQGARSFRPLASISSAIPTPAYRSRTALSCTISLETSAIATHAWSRNTMGISTNPTLCAPFVMARHVSG